MKRTWLGAAALAAGLALAGCGGYGYGYYASTPPPPGATRYGDMLPVPVTCGWTDTGVTAAARMRGRRDIGRVRLARAAIGNPADGKTAAAGITIAMGAGA